MRTRTVGSLAASSFLGLALVLTPFVPAADQPPAGPALTLRGHHEAVFGIAFSADGKQVVTASGDPSIKVWQADTGKAFKTFAGTAGHTGIVLSLALSPDGSQIATGAADNTLRLWDFPTTKPSRAFDLPDDPRCVAVSPDGIRVAGGARDGTIRVWNAADGKLLHEKAGHAGAVTGLAFSPNGQTLASVGHDGTLRFWNAADGKSLGSQVAHPGPVSGVAFNTGGSLVFTTGPDGSLRFWTMPPAPAKAFRPAFKGPLTALGLAPDNAQLVTGAGRTVRLSTTGNQQSAREFSGAPADVHSVAALSGGSLVAAGCADGTLMLWRGKDGQALMRLPAHAGGVTGVAFNPAGNQLASVGKDGVLRLWALPAAAPRSLPQAEAVAAALSGDNLRLCTAAADRTLRLFKLDNLKAPERQITGHPCPVQAVAVSNDGKSLLSGGDDGVIRLWGSARAEPTGLIGAHAAAVSSLQQIGADRVLSASADGSLKLWRVTPPVKGARLSHAGAVSCAALSADGTRLVTGCADKQVRVWTLDNGQVERTLSGPTLGVLAVALSPKGDRVAAGAADKSVFVWDAGKVARKFTDLPAAVAGVTFTADGKQVVAALADGSVRLLDVGSGKEVRALNAHTISASSVLLTPRGDQVVSGGGDGAVLVSPLAGGAAAVTIKHGSAVAALALSRDGSRLAVGGPDKAVKVYALPGGKVEATIATPAGVRGLAFSPDGKRLAVAGDDGQARLLDGAGALEEFFTHEGSVNAVAFAGDGKRLLSVGADKTARVWAPALLWQRRHDGAVRQAVLSNRGDRVVSAGADGFVRLWNAADGKPVQAVRAHKGAVAGLAVWPDAGKFVTAGDGVVRLWDLSKLPAAASGGKEIDKPAAEMALPVGGEVQSCCLSPGGQRVAVGVAVAGKDQVRVLDAATGKELLALGTADGMPAWALAFLSDNRTLMAAGDGAVLLMDVNIQLALEAHPGGCTAVAWHGNGSQVLTGGVDRQVKLWSLPAGKLDRTFAPLDGPVTGVAFARDSTQVAATAGKALRVWSTADGKQVVARAMPAAGAAVSFNSDRTRLAVAGDDGEARVFDAVTGAYLQGVRHAGAVSGVVFAPSANNALYTASADGTASLHTLTARTLVPAGAPQAGLAVSPNGAQVATAGADGKVRLYSAGSGALERTIAAADKALTCVAFSRNAALVAVGCADDRVRLFNPADGKLVTAITTATAPRALGFHPNNRALVMTGADGSVVVWDATFIPGQLPPPPEFGKVLQTFRHAAAAFDLGFSTSTTSMTFFTAGADRTVKAWKFAAETATRNFGHPNTVNSVAFNREGTAVATGCGDGQVRLFDVAKGALKREIKAHPGKPNLPAAVYCVAFSPDGKHILSASFDQSLKLWNVADGKLVREFRAFKEKGFPRGHQEAVLCAAFSPDGKQIASGGMDRSIKVWNVATGEVERELVNPALRPPTAHPGWVYALRWLDGGKTLVAVGGAPRLKGALSVWDMTTGKLIDGREMAVGTIFALGVSPDEKLIAVGTGGSIRAEKDYNTGLIFKRGK